MLKTIATIAMAVTALFSAPAQKEVIKPPLAEGSAIVIQVVPHERVAADENYAVEGEQENENLQTAQDRYNDRKAALDERFAQMFELKAELERTQSETSKKWEEYYALHEKYNRELKRIVSAWVFESHNEGDGTERLAPPPRREKDDSARPTPYRYEHDEPIGEHVPHTLEEK